MKKFECQLCGGKIRNGRCELCGWVNQDQKNYLLNKSQCDDQALTHVHKEEIFSPWEGKSQKGRHSKAGKASKNNKASKNVKVTKNPQISRPASSSSTNRSLQNMRETQGSAATVQSARTQNTRTQQARTQPTRPLPGTKPNPVNQSRKNDKVFRVPQENQQYRQVQQQFQAGTVDGTKRPKKKGSCLRWLIILMIVFGIGRNIAGVIVESVSEIISEFQNDSASTQSEDTYGYVTRELSETGEEWDTTLTAGEYVVGVDLPEGLYRLEAVRGDGTFQLNDTENLIYISNYFAENPSSEDELQALDEVRFYNHAYVKVQGSLRLHLVSENAQTELKKAKKNPLPNETILIQNGESTVVGEEIEPGVYDVTVAGTDAWASLEYGVAKEDSSEDFDYYYVFLDSKYGDDGSYTYYHLTLPEGAQLRVDGGDVELNPSDRIITKDYMEMYR